MAETVHDLNVIGAFALAVSDDLLDVAATESHAEGARAAAVVSLAQMAEGRSINSLAGALRVSHSRAVRIADALEADGLARRTAARDDGRLVRLRLTRKGRTEAARVQRARSEVLERVLTTLSEKERVQLAGLASKVLEFCSEPARAHSICRLCDADGCGHYHGRCPVTSGAKSAQSRAGR